jgi:hypothetical protein
MAAISKIAADLFNRRIIDLVGLNKKIIFQIQSGLLRSKMGDIFQIQPNFQVWLRSVERSAC